MRIALVAFAISLCATACSGQREMERIVEHFKVEELKGDQAYFSARKDKVLAALIARDEETLLALTAPIYRKQLGDKEVRRLFTEEVLRFFTDDVNVTEHGQPVMVKDEAGNMGFAYHFELKGKDSKVHFCQLSIVRYGSAGIFLRTIAVK